MPNTVLPSTSRAVTPAADGNRIGMLSHEWPRRRTAEKTIALTAIVLVIMDVNEGSHRLDRSRKSSTLAGLTTPDMMSFVPNSKLATSVITMAMSVSKCISYHEHGDDAGSHEGECNH